MELDIKPTMTPTHHRQREGRSFPLWMASVDAAINELIEGYSHDDMKDIDYYGLFDAGAEPITAAYEAIRESGYGELLNV